jgi:long-chain acyl-CoA synthetase
MSDPQVGSLEFWAAKTPEEPAIIHDGTVLTYQDWNDRADRLADALVKHGLGPGDHIGVRLHTGAGWAIAHRAFGKLGVVQVSVNWRLTPSEAAYILRDSGAAGLICDDADLSGWDELDLPFLLTVGQPAGSSRLRMEDLLDEGDLERRQGPVNPPTVIYTAGTTGHPKGVPPADPATVDLERLARYRAALLNNPPIPEQVRALMTLPVHHAAGPLVASLTMERGGCLIMLDRYDPEKVLALIDEHKAQTWLAVPTMLLRLQALPPEVVAKYDLTSLEALSVGAAPVPAALKLWIAALLGENVLWESYGCTEAGMVTVLTPEDLARKTGSSGRPYPAVKVKIVDPDWNEMPPGVDGDIAVNSPGTFRGYLGQQPLGDDLLRDGYYRTGDIGRFDDEGYLYVTDRSNDMIVAGGTNIYPAEIEKVLVDHPDVVDAAVIGVPEPDFGEQPLAVVVASPGKEPTLAELLAFASPRLARYKLPRQLELVDELPLSPTGKILKTELRKIYRAKYGVTA